MDVTRHNRDAWDKEARAGNKWTVPVDAATVARARAGDWSVVLTPARPVPREWFGELDGADLLGLASAGGQQGPILAAAGAQVSIFDNSPVQLSRDREVSDLEGLGIETVLGDMADLSVFPDGRFDLIFHPVSNCFVPDVLPVWRECFRVLRPGGALLAGFANPVVYAIDYDGMLEDGRMVITHRIPYADTDRPRELLDPHLDAKEPLEFGHTLEAQIGGQLAAGFVLTDLFEDTDTSYSLGRYMATYLATRAVKPG